MKKEYCLVIQCYNGKYTGGWYDLVSYHCGYRRKYYKLCFNNAMETLKSYRQFSKKHESKNVKYRLVGKYLKVEESL